MTNSSYSELLKITVVVISFNTPVCKYYCKFNRYALVNSVQNINCQTSISPLCVY